ncbi:MAG: SMP-30/gluconolactonase/LRE family protein [Acetobacteraceae bacterium]|nr:SMP-30/gluconolactonase/LRE family protein [Acetobacteraceae bacterium]
MHRRGFLRGAAVTAGSGFATAALAQSQTPDPPGTTPPPRNWDDPTLVVYPDPAMEVFDARFKKYIAGTNTLRRVWSDGQWTEGPVYFGDMHAVIFSDIPNNRLLCYDELTGRTRVFRDPSNFTNGNTRDRQGRLISCEQGFRRVTRTEYTGEITVLADSYQGKKLNSPNGVIVKSDDTIWFTDPTYGIEGDNEGVKAKSELPRNVYRLDPKSGQLTVAAGDFTEPNGLCFSPDEKKMYISDTANPPSVIRVFDVGEDGKLTNDRVFHDLKDTNGGVADDMRVDVDGNLWSAGGWAPNKNFNGVSVYAPDGTPLGRIVLPEVAGNLCFGGLDHHHSTLYVCASHSLYAYDVGTRGVEL